MGGCVCVWSANVLHCVTLCYCVTLCPYCPMSCRDELYLLDLDLSPVENGVLHWNVSQTKFHNCSSNQNYKDNAVSWLFTRQIEMIWNEEHSKTCWSVY